MLFTHSISDHETVKVVHRISLRTRLNLLHISLKSMQLHGVAIRIHLKLILQLVELLIQSQYFILACMIGAG